MELGLWFVIRGCLKEFFRKGVVWSCVLIAVTAAFFRLSSLGLMEFQADQAVYLAQAVSFFSHPKIQLIGPVSDLGVHHFPFFNYLMLVLAWPSKDPQAITFLIAVINVLAVLLFYFVVAKFYSRLVAFYSSMVLATSPWLINYSRSIWPPNLFLLFLVPCIFYLHKIMVNKGSGRVMFGLFFFLGLSVQLHFSGLFLLTSTLLVLGKSRILTNWRFIITGLLISLIFALPYFYFQISSKPFCPDCQALMIYEGYPRIDDLGNIIRPFQLTSGSFFNFILGDNDYSKFITVFPGVFILNQIFDLQIFVLFASMVFIFLHRRKYTFVPLIVILVSFLYLISQTASFPHRYAIVIPFVALTCGIGLELFLQLAKQKWLKAVIGLIFLSFILANMIFEIYFMSYLSLAKDIRGDYGPIYTETRGKIDQKLSKYKGVANYESLQTYAYLFQVIPMRWSIEEEVRIKNDFPKEFAILEREFSPETK